MDKQPKERSLASHNNSDASPALIDRSVGLTITVLSETKAKKVSQFSDGTKRIDHKFSKTAMPRGINDLIAPDSEGSEYEVQ